ncbi:MAG: UTP--glucose-1-phosphate uridylyltransferase [Candidatus Margulisbacteria bacterium]|nr:UTP--glucose-1-phosphate uridylyltransferase [Candidatus Margulisiibacteriota bacterium]
MQFSPAKKALLNVYHISWALQPFAHAGPGPGFFACGIPAELRKLGINCSVVIPEHRPVSTHKPAFLTLPHSVQLAPEKLLPVNVKEGHLGDIQFFSIGNPALFDREKIYAEPDELLRIIFFSLGTLLFLQNHAAPPDVVVCHDWQTGLIPAYLKIHGERIFARAVPSIFYNYKSPFLGIFPLAALAPAGLGFEHFSPFPNLSMIAIAEVARRFADRVVEIEDPAKVTSFEEFARRETGLFRTLLAVPFLGMEHADPSARLAFQSFLPEEKLDAVSPYVAQIVRGNLLAPEQTLLILTAAENSQACVFKDIVNFDELTALLKDLQQIDWAELAAFRKRALAFSPITGQIEGEIRILKPYELDEIGPIEDTELESAGLAELPFLARGTIITGAGMEFLGTPSPVSIGAYPICELNTSFLGIQAADILAAQEISATIIHWFIMIPAGERGRIVRDHFTASQYFGLDSNQVHFFEQPGVFPLLDRSGNLARDPEKKRLLFFGSGHGQFPLLFKTSGMLELAMKLGIRHLFCSSDSNLAADISSPLYRKILGRHARTQFAATVELVNQRAIEAGGIPVMLDGIPRLLEHFVLPEELTEQARIWETPFNSCNFTFRLGAFAFNYAPPVWVRPNRIRGRKYFEQATLLGDITGNVRTQFLRVPRTQRYINPLRLVLLKEAVREFLEKNHLLRTLNY